MAKETTKTTAARVEEEPIYAAAEIATNAPHLFGYSVDLAKAALAFNKVECCSLEKAKKIIKEFAERKVN